MSYPVRGVVPAGSNSIQYQPQHPLPNKTHTVWLAWFGSIGGRTSAVWKVHPPGPACTTVHPASTSHCTAPRANRPSARLRENELQQRREWTTSVRFISANSHRVHSPSPNLDVLHFAAALCTIALSRWVRSAARLTRALPSILEIRIDVCLVVAAFPFTSSDHHEFPMEHHHQRRSAPTRTYNCDNIRIPNPFTLGRENSGPSVSLDVPAGWPRGLSRCPAVRPLAPAMLTDTKSHESPRSNPKHRTGSGSAVSPDC